MHFILSPAKKLNEKNPLPSKQQITSFLSHSFELIEILQQYSPQELSKLMDISDKLAVLNMERYSQFIERHQSGNTIPAIFLFNGDAYEGLSARTLPEQGIDYLNQHLSLLSGMYGLLNPQDGICPHRLEMGTALANKKGKNLYAFWADIIGKALAQKMAKSGQTTLINLASQEYFKAVVPEHLSCRVITPIFKDWKNGQYKTISFYAKRARGLMVRYAAEQQLHSPEMLKQFDTEGYAFHEAMSDEHQWTFIRN